LWYASKKGRRRAVGIVVNALGGATVFSTTTTTTSIITKVGIDVLVPRDGSHQGMSHHHQIPVDAGQHSFGNDVDVGVKSYLFGNLTGGQILETIASGVVVFEGVATDPEGVLDGLTTRLADVNKY
jgi:hypothetical protein